MLFLLAAARATPPPPPPEKPEEEINVVQGPRPWVTEWYGRPRGNLRAVSVNGVTSAQALLGAEGGIRYTHAPIVGKGRNRRRGSADLAGRTRLQGDVLYGLLANSVGADIRLGSFIGPTSRYVTWQIGPDVWFNGYGNTTSADYFLPWSLGVDLSNTVIFHPSSQVSFQVGITPGWAFDKDRQVNRLGPVHELSGFGLVAIQAGSFSFVVGYQRSYNAAGTSDGLILSAGF